MKKGNKMVTLSNFKRKFSKLFQSFKKKKIGKKHSQKRSNKNKRRTKKQRGGYHQYMSNVPFTPSYSVAGVNLKASSSALANPPPITRTNNCVDNLNANTNKGFQFW